jgi:hypothetical protein
MPSELLLYLLLLCCFRNVHPSSRLLHAFLGSPGLPPGMMIISSTAVLLCSCMPAAAAATAAGAAASAQTACSSAAAAAAGASPGGLAVRKVQLLQWQLAGVPLSCVAVPGSGSSSSSSSSYVVGDDRAGEAAGQMLFVQQANRV